LPPSIRPACVNRRICHTDADPAFAFSQSECCGRSVLKFLTLFTVVLPLVRILADRCATFERALVLAEGSLRVGQSKRAGLAQQVRVCPGGKYDNAKREGFSLIELLIVVAIILIIAAIAILDLLRARVAANELSAAAGVRKVNTAEITYTSTYPTVGFAGSLPVPGGPIAAACHAVFHAGRQRQERL
jgi:prepilin-type N-terminal cleavage/methylation domain-containing protein